MVQGSLGTSATVHDQPPLLDSTDHRTVEASAEVSVDDVTWTLDVLLTHEYALQHASGMRDGASLDLLSETDVLDAATVFVKSLAVGLRETLAERDVSSRLGTIFARATEGYAGFHGASHARWIAVADGGGWPRRRVSA